MVRTTVGYSGGTTAGPTYRSMGDHSEVIQIEYDPQKISYTQLLEVFWESHEPTFAAYSRQYRNAIFTYDQDQQTLARETLAELSAVSRKKIETVIEPAGDFYAAEDYHQKYLLRKAEGIVQELKAIYPNPADFAASTAAARLNGYLGCNGDPERLSQEVGRLGLSSRMQARLIEYVRSSCSGFAGLTCPDLE